MEESSISGRHRQSKEARSQPKLDAVEFRHDV